VANTRGKTYDREFLVSKIAMMRIKGKSTHSVLEFLMEQVGMSRKIAYEVLGDAQKYIMEQTSEDTKVAFAEAIQRLEIIYENGNDKVKLEALKEINKLRGLYSPEKLDITSNGQTISEIKIIEIRNEQKPGAEDNTGVQ
jgi:hypothetical protein